MIRSQISAFVKETEEGENARKAMLVPCWYPDLGFSVYRTSRNNFFC